MSFFAGQVAERTRPGQRQDVEEKGTTHGTLARSLSNSTVRLHLPRLQPLRRRLRHHNHRFRIPQACRSSASLQADSIMKIQKELDETKIVLHKTIESVLERGEKIDTLVQKSDGLSAQSKMFYTQVCREYVKVTRLDANTLSRPKSRTRAASSCKCWSRFAGFLILLGRSQRDFIVETSNPAYRLHSIRTIHSVF